MNETEEYDDDDLSKPRKSALQEQVEGFSRRSLLGQFGEKHKRKDYNSGRLRSHAIILHDPVPADCIEKVVARGMGSSRRASNRRRRANEGPEPACVSHFCSRAAHVGGRRANQRPAVVPSCRRGKNLQRDARREVQAARKGKWSPRGTVMTVLTYPGMRLGDRQGW